MRVRRRCPVSISLLKKSPATDLETKFLGESIHRECDLYRSDGHPPSHRGIGLLSTRHHALELFPPHLNTTFQPGRNGRLHVLLLLLRSSPAWMPIPPRRAIRVRKNPLGWID